MESAKATIGSSPGRREVKKREAKRTASLGDGFGRGRPIFAFRCLFPLFLLFEASFTLKSTTEDTLFPLATDLDHHGVTRTTHHAIMPPSPLHGLRTGAPLPARHLYEVLVEKKPCWLYFDLDSWSQLLCLDASEVVLEFSRINKAAYVYIYIYICKQRAGLVPASFSKPCLSSWIRGEPAEYLSPTWYDPRMKC